MGLATQDFVTAYRALSSQAVTAPAILKALRLQAARIEKGSRLTLAEALVESRAVTLQASQELASFAPVDIRRDPEALTITGELFLQTEAASEVELDRVVDGLSKPADPRTLKEVPVPPGLSGYDFSWEVGRSRAGSVYRGSKRGTGAAVAIKIFRPETFDSPESKKAFLDRMGAVAVSHEGPEFIKVLEALDLDGHAVVVQEFVEGETLEKLLAERKVSLRRGFEILARVAAAVAPSHARGAAHGRLSTRSIFVQANDRPRIDSPGPRDGVTPADDVAALGAVLYEIAAGAPPFGGFRSHQLKPPSRHNPSCAGAPEKIILKALARDPARRYANADALAGDIGRFLRHEDVTADVDVSEAAPPSRPVLVRRRPRWGWKVAAAAAAVLIVAALIAIFSGGGNGATAPSPAAPVVSLPPVSPPSLTIPPTPRPAPPAPPKKETRIKELAAKGPLKANEEIDFQFKASDLLTKRAFEELDQLAEEALVRGPESGWAHYYRAFVALERGDDENALKHADRALALEYTRSTLYELRFDIRLARAEYRLALEELGRLYPRVNVSAANQEILRLNREIEKDPHHGPALIRRGALFLYRRLSGRAVDDFTKAVAAGESRADYFLALALKEEDKIAEAIEAVRRFLAAHEGTPGGVEAKAFLASLPQ